MKPLLIALAFWLTATSGYTQPLPAVPGLDRYIGQVVRVTDDTGQTVTGLLLDVSNEKLVISQAGAPAWSVATAAVKTVTRPFAPGKDARSGLIVGAVLGGVSGAVAGALACAESCDTTGPAVAVFGVAGIGVGLGIAVGRMSGSIVETFRRGDASHQSLLMRSTLFGAGIGALVGAGIVLSCCKDDTQAIALGTASTAALGAATAAIVAGRREPVLFRGAGHPSSTRFSTAAVITPARKSLLATVTF
jgi:hypothetical protein